MATVTVVKALRTAIGKDIPAAAEVQAVMMNGRTVRLTVVVIPAVATLAVAIPAAATRVAAILVAVIRAAVIPAVVTQTAVSSVTRFAVRPVMSAARSGMITASVIFTNTVAVTNPTVMWSAIEERVC